MHEREQSLRRALSIPDTATQVLILEQSAHCDWDWNATFPEYYNPGGDGHQAVRQTLIQATDDLRKSTPELPYRYAFCEVAYLQAWWNDESVPAANLQALQDDAGLTFFFSSGGITSAENLTLHTEAFIRNYLLGRQWLWDTFGVTASNQMWIPDDFGHDAQLPVLLQAMGFTGAGFWRIPAQWGITNGVSCETPAATAPSSFLPGIGLDFHWEAADGSKIQAHWLWQSYCEGNNTFDPFGGGIITNGLDAIEQLFQQNTNGLPQPATYLFAPIDCDFTAPYDNLAQVIYDWNLLNPSRYVRLSSFDDFMQLRGAAGGLSTVRSNPPDGQNVFVPHPYYSGCYGSKPAIKTAHYQATRTLLLAESMEVILEALAKENPGQWGSAASQALGDLSAAWNKLAPSTHHDYITGTSPDDVYSAEQLTDVQQARDMATAAASYVLGQVASAIAPAQKSGAVAVFNSLGFPRTSIASVPEPPPGDWQSVTSDFITYTPAQSAAKGGLFFQATVGSLGYTTMYLSEQPENASPALSANLTGGVATLSNGSLTATIDVTGIKSLTAAGSSVNVFDGENAAGLVFYNDTGNLYRFAMEMPCYAGQFNPDDLKKLRDATISLDAGKVLATVEVKGNVSSHEYTILYQLSATDTALRIIVTGAAPTFYSVMWRFPFAGTAASLRYGTTSHWDTRAKRDFFGWSGTEDLHDMTFEPTHEYVLPLDADGNAIAAIYHEATPGWAIDPKGAVIGCILRNTPGGGNAASGTDVDAHTVSFSIRPPDGLLSPREFVWRTGAPLGEALGQHNPLVGVALPAAPGSALPASMSIAQTRREDVLLSALKAGTVTPSSAIVRLYQPTNRHLFDVDVVFDWQIARAYQYGGILLSTWATAMETASSENHVTSMDVTGFLVNLPRALSTVAVGTEPPQR